MKQAPASSSSHIGGALRRHWRVTAAIAYAALGLCGCAGINIFSPVDNAVIVSPDKAHVSISGSASFTSLTVSVDGVDHTAEVPMTSSSSAEGDIALGIGSHTVTARAIVSCPNCAGGSAPSSSSHSFVVKGAGNCVVAGGPPTISLSSTVIAAGKVPGRQQIAYKMMNGNIVLILVDDAPLLLPTQMLVSVDIDPFNGETGGKKIEAQRCAGPVTLATVRASMIGGINVGTACADLTSGNNFSSGCTNTSPPMMPDQSTMDQLSMNGDEIVDASIWQAFGGRSLRFIWRCDSNCANWHP